MDHVRNVMVQFCCEDVDKRRFWWFTWTGEALGVMERGRPSPLSILSRNLQIREAG